MNAEFKPANLLEHALVNAATDPAARPIFFRELLDSNILVVPIGEVPAIVNGFIQADTKISLANFEYNGHSCVAIFTSEARITPGTKYLIMPAKAFFEMTRGSFVMLNPGSAYGKEFVPDEIARLLNGTMFQPMERYVVQKATQVMIGTPKDYPTELVEALSRLYKKSPAVERAWIAFYHNPERDKEGCMLLCLDTNNPSIFDRLSSDSGVVYESMIKKRQFMDIIRYEDNGLPSYFTKQKPFYQKGGLGQLLSRWLS
jgi:hypothetical protein